MLIPDTMIRILNQGGSLDIDCAKNVLLPDVMEDLATAAANGGAHITFRNDEQLLPETALRVVSAGQGMVTFAV